MKIKRRGYKKIPYETIVRRYFAWWPVEIDGDWRWLEWVEVRGYWWQGQITERWYWEGKEFIN